MEIERRFLVIKPPLSLATSVRKIRQGYLAIDDAVPSSVRIRHDGQYTLTVKAGDGLSRYEEPVELSPEEFERLWPLTFNTRLEKTRHLIPLTRALIEVDHFEGRHAGLVMAEVEFETVEQAAAFEPPSWFGMEVTYKPTFTNAWLARHGNPLR